MENKTLGKRQLDYLRRLHIFKTFLNVYKYCPNSFAVLERYVSVCDQIKGEYYPEVKSFYKDEEEIFKAYGQKRMIGYIPVKWFMKSHILIPREKVIAQLREAIDELMRFGIYYFDIHYSNILWNGDSIKLVDMDGAVIDNERYFYHIYYNLVDFVLELYFYYRHPLNDYCIPIFLERIQNSEIFSKEFVEYLESVYENMDKEAIAQIDPFLLELQDEERVQYAIKHYIQK